MKHLIFTVSLVFFTTPAFAFLGSSPEKCEEVYGKPRFTHVEGGETTHGYLPQFEGFGGAVVMASFRNNVVTFIQYKIEKQKAFTPDQFALIATLNSAKTGGFVEVGYTPNRTKWIWGRKDELAYLVVEQDRAVINIMSREGAMALLSEMQTK